MVLFLTGVACLAPVLAPADPFSLGDIALSEPSSLHLMGTDHLGRDILSAVLWGLRVSLLVGVCAALIAVVLGVCIGGPAGYFGAKLDHLLMRATDAVMVLPTFFLVLIVVAIFGGSIWKLIALIGITNWPPVARLVRAEFLSLRERDFALAAKAVGAGHVMIMVRHILPNALPVQYMGDSLELTNAFIAGHLDAVTSIEPYATRAKMATNGNVLGDGTDIYGTGYPDCVLVARKELITKEPEVVKNVIRMFFEAEYEIETNFEEAAKLTTGKYYKTDMTNLLAAAKAQPPGIDTRDQRDFMFSRAQSMTSPRYGGLEHRGKW